MGYSIKAYIVVLVGGYLDVDARAKFQTEDVAKRSEVIRDRFEVIMLHHSSEPWWALHLTAHPDGGLPLP